MHRSKKGRAGESKADARYWLQGNRLRFHDSADYAMQIQAEGKRIWFSLGTPNRKGAAMKAATIYTFIKSHGLAAAVSEFKPKSVRETQAATVGNVILAASRLSSARKESLEAYSKAFRLIVSEIEGIEYAVTEEGKAWTVWRVRVDAVELAGLTPSAVVAWKQARLRKASTDPIQKGKAAVTVNSLIRNAKALFGKKLLPFLDQEMEIPRPLPFEGIGPEKTPSMRYVSRIDAFAILARAKEELSAEDPEAFKVMILALVCGLRRGEIDNLLWRAFDFPRKLLRVENSEYHELKSNDSVGEIDLNDETVALFRGLRAKTPTAIFVIDSDALAPGQAALLKRKTKASKDTKTRTYRCDAIFTRVIRWLRAQGVESTKPLHTMRKEIGSIINNEHGIFETSRYLRHSDIRITSAIYVDKKKKVTPASFDGLLSDSSVTEIPKAAIKHDEKGRTSA